MNEQNQTKARAWLVSGEPVVIDGEHTDVLYEELAECLMLLRRVGGAITIQTAEGNLVIGAVRERSDEYGDFYITRAYAFKWTPSVPSARRVQPDPEPEPAEEQELVLEPAEA